MSTFKEAHLYVEDPPVASKVHTYHLSFDR